MYISLEGLLNGACDEMCLRAASGILLGRAVATAGTKVCELLFNRITEEATAGLTP